MKITNGPGRTAVGDIPETLRHAFKRRRFASAYLVYGRPPGEFEKSIVSLLSMIVCSNSDSRLDACGHCRDCIQAENLTHPDIVAPGAPGFTGDQGVNDRFGVQSVRESIIEPATLTPARCTYKLFWLHDLTRFTTEASNSLLTVLEEPPGETIFFLTSRSRWDCLPTIRSRCQWIRIPSRVQNVNSFREKCEERMTEPPTEEDIANWLKLLHGESRSRDFNWSRSSARQFLQFLLLLIRDCLTDRLLEDADHSYPEKQLSHRLIPDILQRLNELERGGNPPLVINSLLEEIYYPEELNEWVNVT